MRLFTKLTLTLLAVSLLTATLVGCIAYGLLMQDFRQSIQDQAFANFQEDVTAYLQQYGSWEIAVNREPFPQFVRRMRDPRLHGPGAFPRPPADGFVLRRGRAPFLFMLADPSGRVIKPGPGFEEGQQLSPRLLASARPIEHRGQLALLAIPLGEPNLTPQDESYLAAMRRALGYGLAAAAALAMLLGLFAGRRLSQALAELTEAVHGMRADGELKQPVAVRSKDEVGELAAAFNRMSAELSQAHQEMRELALRDPLTQLYNRRHFSEQAAQVYAQAVRYGQPLTVMIADLDHFKQINDGLSHAVGDEVLRRVAGLLKANTREADILARHGGEEFVLLFPQTSLAAARDRCEALRQQIEAADWGAVHPALRVTMSIGLNDEIGLGSVERMLSAADVQLYAAKDAGRNCVQPAA